MPLLALTHLKEPLGVEEEGGCDERLSSPGRDPGQASVCKGCSECHMCASSLIPQAQGEAVVSEQVGQRDQLPSLDMGQLRGLAGILR